APARARPPPTPAYRRGSPRRRPCAARPASPRLPPWLRARARRAPQAPAWPLGQFLRQGRQDARAGLDQRHSQATLVEHLQPVVLERGGGVAKLGGEFNPGGAAADDGDIDIGGRGGIVGKRARDAQAMVEQLEPEAVGLFAVLKKQAIARDAGRAEVVRHRADGDDEIIVADAMAPDQLGAVLVEQRRDDDLLGLAVDRLQRAEEEAVAPAVGVAAVADLVQIGVEGAGGDLVQQRLPDMGAVALDEDDVERLLAEPVAEPAHQLEPTGAAADDYDLGFHVAPHRHGTVNGCVLDRPPSTANACPLT